MISKSFLVVILLLSLVLSVPVFQVRVAVGYVPHQGDHFSYYEVENLGNGTGSYAGYSEHTVVNGTERMNGVGGDGIVSAYYSYSSTFSNSSGSTVTGTQSGNYTFSSTSFLYVNGTDDQTGYVNPTVWFAMNSSIPKGGTFSLLNTQMTVMSRNYSYYLPSQNRNVMVIFAQGISSYLRNDQYGEFPATYTWNAYFDPSTGYIVGYGYVERDANSSGNGFTYTDELYVSSTSYPLTAAASSNTGTVTTSLTQSTSSVSSTGTLPASNNSTTQYVGYIAGIAVVVVILAILIYAFSRSSRRTLPKHPPQQPSPGPPPEIDLTPKQPPVQQIVIKEVAKVNCKYCGTLIDSTAQVCPRCGAPRT